MTAEQLATKAGKAKLLGTPGKDPVRSMKAALARELKKADASRIVAVGDDLWQLAPTGADESAPATPAKKKKTAAKAKPDESKAARSATPAKKAAAKKAPSKKTAAKKSTAKKAEKVEAPEVSEPAAVEVSEAAGQDQAAAAAPAAPSKKRKSRRRKKQVETAVETAVSMPEAAEAEADVQAPEPAEAPAAAEEAAAALEAPAAAESLDIPGAETGGEAAGEAPGKKRRNRRSRRKRRGNREEGAEAVTAIEVTAVEVAAGDVADVAAEPEPEPISVEQLTDVLAPKEMPVRADVPVTPDEAEIQAIYGDELSGTEPGAAFAEYEDELTEDEDRPMSPEMVSTRPDRQRRERRRRRERQRGEVVAARPQPHKEHPERPAATPVSQAPAPSAAEIATDIYWPGNRLAARATAVLHGAEKRTLRGKQLARLMNTRGLLAGSPDTTWPHLESALVHDEKSRVARGMRPRVTARGRGTFEAVAQVSDRELAASESALENAVATALAATHRALSRRLSALELPELERVAHVFLTTQGYDDIAWIKRSQRSSYAVAVAPGGLGELLVGVRAGSDPVDRGGVGELRVGVQAKKLASGLLLAPSPLSEAARQELRRNGPSLSVIAGDGFVSALVHAGIGVTVAHIAVPLVDDAFLSALAESE